MAQDFENVQNDDLGEKLNAMLSDPESLSRLAGMASALASSGVLSGLMGSSGSARNDGPDEGSTETAANQGEDQHTAENPSAEKLPAEVSSGHGTIRAVNGRHAALLRALKPYLGEQKQARIDQMMRLLQLAELADAVLRGK